MKRITPLILTSILITLASCNRPANTVLMERGNYAMWQGRWSDAAIDYGKAIDQHPGDWEAQYKLGKCYLEMSDPLMASHSLAIAESIQPSNTDVADLLAISLLECGDNDRLFSFLQTRANKIQTTRAWTKLAEYSMAIDDPDSATTAINTAIELSNGQSAEPYIVAATFAERLGDSEAATSWWKEAWYINPQDQRVADALRSHGIVPGPTMTGITEDSE